MANLSKTKIGHSIEELREQYIRNSCGHWFDADTMRFFQSRLTSNYRRIDDGTALFISTERGPSADSKRKATVRLARLTNEKRKSDGRYVVKISISSVSGFNQLTIGKAKKIMQAFTLEQIGEEDEVNF